MSLSFLSRNLEAAENVALADTELESLAQPSAPEPQATTRSRPGRQTTRGLVFRVGPCHETP